MRHAVDVRLGAVHWDKVQQPELVQRQCTQDECLDTLLERWRYFYLFFIHRIRPRVGDDPLQVSRGVILFVGDLDSRTLYSGMFHKAMRMYKASMVISRRRFYFTTISRARRRQPDDCLDRLPVTY